MGVTSKCRIIFNNFHLSCSRVLLTGEELHCPGSEWNRRPKQISFFLKKPFLFHFVCVKPEVVHDAGVVVLGAGSHAEGGHGVELGIRKKDDFSSYPYILGRNICSYA